MPHTYYINSATGSNANVGTSTSTPFKSITALNNLTLHPGDSVLLARGASFSDQLTVKNSGVSGNPITFGAYGQGAAPVIKGPATGVYSSGTHDVVVHDIAIAHTSGYAVLGRNVSNWTIDNVAVSSTGSATHAGSVSFENSSNVTVKNSTISGVTGDGILINGGHGITVANNTVGTVQGPAADNVQIGAATGVTITGNHLDMSGTTNSTKGNLVVNKSDGVDIEHNTLVGGKYGASVNSNNVTIASNDIHGQKGYSWSFGVGLAENWNVKNYNIHDNNIHDVARGVAVTGASTTLWRENIDVHNNTFSHMGTAALVVDRNASGDFLNNHVSADSTATQISSWIAQQGKFPVSGTVTDTATPLVAHTAFATLSTNAAQVSGGLLANDTSPSNSTLSVSSVDGHAVGNGLDVAGKYGTVSIDANGNFVFHADAKATAGISQPVSDTFSYVVTDGHSQAQANLLIDLAAGDHSGPHAVNDAASVSVHGTASGNALANDQHPYGDTLFLRSIGDAKIGSGSSADVAGLYGTLHIAADGAFTYAADASKFGVAGGMLHDSFTYKMSDGIAQDSASLGFTIDPHTVSAQATSDFHI
ncbi:MAG: Polysaccharidase [Hyphomicrobiales bacterium]|nr:Polysaccharidase [Hyphomicrobiales bacterium]